MKLTDPLPRPVAWITRGFFYTIAGAIVLAQCTTIGKFGQLKSMTACADDPAMTSVSAQSALLRTQALANCLEKKNNFIENLMQWSLRKTIRGLPNTPEAYVGTWVSSQPSCSYCLRIKADGEFSAEPIACNISTDSFSGSWGVHQDKMVWMYDNGKVWPPDINPIEDRAPDHFVLVEANGSRTQFRRAGETSGQCGKEPEPATVADLAEPTPAEPLGNTGEAGTEAPEYSAEPSADGPAADSASGIHSPEATPGGNSDPAILDAAQEVATIEVAVDSAQKMCRQRAPQQAATVQLAKDRWRRTHADLIARKNAYLRNFTFKDEAARVTNDAVSMGEEMIAPIGRASADTVRAWCADAAQAFESGRFNLSSDPARTSPLLVWVGDR